ncbi:down syndrome cell adhesion molecule-like protein Dscam2 [Trichonephila clavipes]|nr:down syndrome cell adhesion molecule-like protein Dscam2 [Trichonephila clavipes]
MREVTSLGRTPMRDKVPTELHQDLIASFAVRIRVWLGYCTALYTDEKGFRDSFLVLEQSTRTYCEIEHCSNVCPAFILMEDNVHLQKAHGYLESEELEHIGQKPSNNQLPRVIQEPSVWEVWEGKTARLPCVAHGHPSPQYYWFRDTGGQLTLMDTVRKFSVVDGTLVIHKVSVADSGKYICFANNSVGEDKVDRLLRIRVRHGHKERQERSCRPRETRKLEEELIVGSTSTTFDPSYITVILVTPMTIDS